MPLRRGPTWTIRCLGRACANVVRLCSRSRDTRRGGYLALPDELKLRFRATLFAWDAAAWLNLQKILDKYLRGKGTARQKKCCAEITEKEPASSPQTMSIPAFSRAERLQRAGLRWLPWKTQATGMIRSRQTQQELFSRRARAMQVRSRAGKSAIGAKSSCDTLITYRNLRHENGHYHEPAGDRAGAYASRSVLWEGWRAAEPKLGYYSGATCHLPALLHLGRCGKQRCWVFRIRSSRFRPSCEETGLTSVCTTFHMIRWNQ